MFRRIYSVSLDVNGKRKQTTVRYEFDSLKSMESTPLINITEQDYKDFKPLVEVDEYDEKNRLIISYEYHDPAYSIESISVYDRKIGLKVSVFINTRDEHGRFGNISSPAHVHVKNPSKMDIGQININGPCPGNGSEVVLYRTNVPKEFDKYRSDMAKWANSYIEISGERMHCWDYAQKRWQQLESEGIFQ